MGSVVFVPALHHPKPWGGWHVPPFDRILCLPSPRTKLLESESMNESLRRSLSRVSARPPYSVGSSPVPGLAAPAETEASDVLRRAKQDLERLKKKERRQRRKR